MTGVFTKILLFLFILILLSVIVVLFANNRFNKMVDREIEFLFSENIDNHTEIIEENDLANLPTVVKNWMYSAQVVGNNRIKYVRLKQKATMRLDKNKSWMSVKADQYFTTEEPGFIWKARIKMMPFFHIMGRDKYNKGKGHMLIKIMSLFPVADEKGKKLDQGTLLRFLGESIWFPTAALSDYINWEEIDKNKARATMSYGDISASGIFTFNEDGYPVNFTARRYAENNGEYSLEDWSIDMTNHKNMDGVIVPTEGEVTWEYEDGDFTWYKFKLADLEYNNPSKY